MNNKSNSNNKQVQKNKKIIRGKNKMEKDEKKKFPAKSVHAHAHMQPYPFLCLFHLGCVMTPWSIQKQIRYVWLCGWCV